MSRFSYMYAWKDFDHDAPVPEKVAAGEKREKFQAGRRGRQEKTGEGRPRPPIFGLRKKGR